MNWYDEAAGSAVFIAVPCVLALLMAGRTARRGRAAFGRCFQELFPLPSCVYIELKLRNRIAAEGSTVRLNASMEGCIHLPLESLKEAHALELSRREAIRKVAQANLAAATIAVSFAMGSFGLIAKTAEPIAAWPQEGERRTNADGWTKTGNIASRVGIGLGVFSLVASAYCAIRAGSVDQVFDMFVQTLVTPYGRATSEGDTKAKLIKCIYLNQGRTLIVGNYAYASSVLMRNGVIAIGAVLMLGVIRGGRLW